MITAYIEETPTKAKQNIKSSENNDENNNITYKTYTNKRFLYSIDYPSKLMRGNGGEDGSGMEFKNDDVMVTLGVSGINNATFETAEQNYNEMLNHLKVQPSYKHLESNSYTLSWDENGMISYRYFVDGNIHNGSFNDFTFKYPAKYYDQVVVKIRNSFKTPGIDTSH